MGLVLISHGEKKNLPILAFLHRLVPGAEICGLKSTIEFGDFGISERSTLMKFVEPIENDPEHDDRPDAKNPSVIIGHTSFFY